MPRNEPHRRFDKRVIRHYLERGALKHDELKAHLESLEDVAELGAPTETRMEHSGSKDEDANSGS